MIKFKLFGNSQPDTTATATGAPLTANNSDSPMDSGTSPANPGGKRVLIVDDDALFLKTTAIKLRSQGFQVDTATESSAAIAALSETHMDAVVMDVNLPPDVGNGGMGSWDGFQLLCWLRNFPTTKGTRYIIVSGSDTPANRKRAKEVGAVAYFQKPVDNQQLSEVLSRAA